MSARWVVPVHSPCPLSIIHTCWLVIWKRKYPKQWPFVFNITQINSWNVKGRQLRSSQTSLSFTVVAIHTMRSSFFSFSWESLNNRWVLSNTPMHTKTMYFWTQCTFEVFCKRNKLFVFTEYRVSFYVAITFLRLNSKPVRLSTQRFPCIVNALLNCILQILKRPLRF